MFRLTTQHQRERALARTQGGGLTLLDGPEELKAEFELPNTRDGEDVAELINPGAF